MLVGICDVDVVVPHRIVAERAAACRLELAKQRVTPVFRQLPNHAMALVANTVLAAGDGNDGGGDAALEAGAFSAKALERQATRSIEAKIFICLSCSGSVPIGGSLLTMPAGMHSH